MEDVVSYDAPQNLAKRTNNLTVETFTVNALNQLTSIPDSTPTYDRRGNLVQRYFPAGPQYYWTYSYDHENQLSSVATDTASTLEAYRFKVEFVYDGQGRLRIRRNYTWYNGNWYGSGGETRYLYDGLLLVQERDGGNTPTLTYTRGGDLSGSREDAGGIGGLLARSHGYSGGNWSSHTFYHADGNGTVTALVNSGGALQASYKYDPYGRYLSGGGALAGANGLRFSSKPWVGFAGSTTSGLYYYGYRFYDPYLQRWVNRDPIGERGGINLYGFVRNAPVVQIDALGLLPPVDTGGWPPKCPPPKKCLLYHYQVAGFQDAGECATSYFGELTGLNLGVGAGTAIGAYLLERIKVPQGSSALIGAAYAGGLFGQWLIFYALCNQCVQWES